MKVFADTILISLEGNIGSGKSTVLKELKRRYPEWIFVDEPVNTWLDLKNDQGECLLELFYKDKRRWSYMFQNAAVLHRYKKLQEALNHQDSSHPNIIVMERSIFTDRMVFTKMLKEQRFIDALEWKVYGEWFSLIDSMTPHMDGYVFIDTTPDTCLERIMVRAREGESIIPLDYLHSLDKYHRTWLFDPEHTKPVFNYDNHKPNEFHIETIGNFVQDLLKKKVAELAKV
jgi:deoxyadenosine/deoxycytidine kinase